MPVQRQADGALLTVLLTPKAGSDRIEGVTADAAGRRFVKARVRAVPEKGAANTALEALLAKALGLPKSAVRVQTGATARLKRVAITGDAAAVMTKVETMLKELERHG
jgi:uncharacterized protein YggU (UPF0235/DUF167 family)